MKAASAMLAWSHWGSVLDALGEAAWIVDGSNFQVRAVNQAALDLLGRPREAVLGADADSLIATPEDMSFWDDVKAGREASLDSETVLVDGSGRLVHVARRVQRLKVAADGSAAFLAVVQDRSEQQRERDEREHLVAELQATLESTADGILVTDLAGRIRVFNRRFAQIWGLPQDLLTVRNDSAVFDWMRRSVTDAEVYQKRLAAISEATLLHASERLQLHSGQVLERVTQPQSCQGRPTGRVWAFRDLTDIVQAGQRIEELSTTDALTGLANRRQLGELLTQATRQARRAGQGLALLIVDLDRFRQINDSLGHELGDGVLLETSRRIKTCMRQGDVVARVGGDQFALIVHEADLRGAEAMARRALEAVCNPLALEDIQFTLTCSIGVALYPQDGNDSEVLLRSAEHAMQRAKQGGRACFRFHQQRYDADQRSRMTLDHAMRQALAAQRFRLHYQPQIDLKTGAIIGAEALIRWRDPELGDIAPGKFIPVAEDTGFIIAIGDWVLSQAVRQAAQWRADGLPVQVSVNVSALQFQQADFIERVAAVLGAADLPGSLLELELTESILVHDADEALLRLSALSDMGVRLAIDDFGTGYSSLSYLKRFPIERLKIDRSFVSGVTQDESDAGIVRAIIQMSRALGMKVIAEGVETEPQREFLLRADCDQFQGWLFAPALDATTFEQRLRSMQRQPRRHLALVGR